MIRNLLSVGGFTLLSRVAGFLTTAVQSAVMGAGEVSEEQIFAEGIQESSVIKIVGHSFSITP